MSLKDGYVLSCLYENMVNNKITYLLVDLFTVKYDAVIMSFFCKDTIKLHFIGY